MATVGEMLRTAREAKAISLADAERGTKIRQKYISALEEDNLGALPGPAYARGFLRNYASFLELDADEVMALYDEQRLPTRDKLRAARGEAPAKAATRPDTERISIQPLSSERIDTRVRYGTQYIALSLLAIPLIIVFYFVYSAYAGPKNEDVPIPTVTIRPPTVTTMPITTIVAGGPNGGEFNTPTVFIPPTPNTVSAVTPTLPVTATTVVTTATSLTPTVAVPSAADVTVKVVTTRDAWMSVQIDGVQKFSGTLAKGTNRQWTGKNSIQIRTGRADSVHVFVNGADRGLMGAPNNLIVEKKWDRNGNETVIQQ